MLAALIALIVSHGRAQATPICVDDICFDVPTAIDYAYSVKAADFDNNGLTDLYVQGGSRTAVSDFLILQTTPLEFALATPTAVQRSQGRALPKRSVSVYREELSNDGLLDFHLENVDEVIPGAPDISILTSYGDGTTPQTLIKEDAAFLETVKDIEQALENLDAVMNHYRGQSCGLAIVGYDLYWQNPDDGERYPYNGGNPPDVAPGETVELVQEPIWGTVCVQNSSLPQYQGDLGVFCGGMSTFLSQNGFVNPSDAGVVPRILQRAAAGQIVTGSTGLVASPPSIAGQTAKTVFTRLAARRAAIALVFLAFPPTAVVEVAILAYTGYELYQAVQLNRDIVRRKRRDLLVAPILDNPNYDPQNDPWQRSESCKPWDNVTTQQSAPTTQQGTEQRLGENMVASGCHCRPGGERHHIVPKKGGGTPGDRLRACMEAANINIDWAGNGICLPASDNHPDITAGRTRIASHKNSGLHRQAFIEKLAEDCEQATGGLSGTARYDAGRTFLENVANDLYYWRFLPQ